MKLLNSGPHSVQIESPPDVNAGGLEFFTIRPYKDGRSFDRAQEFVRGLAAEPDSRVSVEPWFTEDQYKLVVGAPNQTVVSDVLESHFPNAVLKPLDRPFPNIEPGESVSVSRMVLSMDCAFPIRFIGSRIRGYDIDPHTDLLPKMTSGNADDRSMVQVAYEPVDESWYKRGLVGSDTDTMADHRSRGKCVGQINPRVVKTPNDDAIKSDMQNQASRAAFRVVVRVITISPDPRRAESRMESIVNVIEEESAHASGQCLEAEYYRGGRLIEELEGAMERSIPRGRAPRRWLQGPAQILTDMELAAWAHIPDGNCIDTNKFQWQTGELGGGVPPGTPREDFEEMGVADATQEEKQLAMLDSSEPGDPIMLGFGSKRGTEAGIWEEYLNAHAQITGGTRKGKTNLLTYLSGQLHDRNYGGLIIVNGKEQDEDRFIEELSPYRDREDFVFVDTGDPDYGTDKRVRFNLLEIPTSAEPGTSVFDSAAETLAEDWAASFAEAGGGTDTYWGPRMDRITKTVIVGLAKRGQTATPLDVAAACTSSDGLGRFRQFMDEERIAFVREQAEQIAEHQDADLEPLAGRMGILTRHSGLRNFLCARDPPASIQEMVREGKWCVLRIDPNLSETEIKFMLTPIVRRFYTAKKTQPNAPRFYCIWDEFDKAVSPMTNIHELLSIAGGHDFRLILSCQAPSNQLYPELKNAMQNQIDTSIAFETGKNDAPYVASHHSVNAESIQHMGRFKFWLRTYWRDDGDEGKTESYLVDSFPPMREAREAHDVPRIRDVDALKRESVERYGDVPKSAEELQQESEFYDSQDLIVGRTDPADRPFELTEENEKRAIEVVYDTMLRSEQEWVTVEATLDLLRSRLGWDGDRNDAWREVYQSIDAVETQGSDPIEMTIMNPRSNIATVGEHQSAGGPEHNMLLFEGAYKPLARIGYDVRISEASGNDPDAMAIPDEDPTDPDMIEELSGGEALRIEAEHDTSTKPGVLPMHLNDAHDEGIHTLVLTRPEKTRTVRETIFTEPAGYRSDHDVDGERRCYTSPRDVNIDGETFKIPGSASVWIETDTGKLALRDVNGEEYARFGSEDDILNNPSKFPTEGDVTIKMPVIPRYDPANVTLGEVPEGTETVDDMRIGPEATIPEKVKPLYEYVRAHADGPKAKIEVASMVEDSELGFSQSTVYRHMREMEEIGVITPDGKTDVGATRFSFG